MFFFFDWKLLQVKPVRTQNTAVGGAAPLPSGARTTAAPRRPTQPPCTPPKQQAGGSGAGKAYRDATRYFISDSPLSAGAVSVSAA